MSQDASLALTIGFLFPTSPLPTLCTSLLNLLSFSCVIIDCTANIFLVFWEERNGIQGCKIHLKWDWHFQTLGSRQTLTIIKVGSFSFWNLGTLSDSLMKREKLFALSIFLITPLKMLICYTTWSILLCFQHSGTRGYMFSLCALWKSFHRSSKIVFFKL